MKVVYIDVLLFINIAANYLLLLAAAKICDIYALRWRMALSAALGGAYAVLIQLPRYSFLGTFAMKLISAAVLVLIAFGLRKTFLRTFAVFTAVSAALGGVVYAVSLGPDGTFSSPGLKALILSFLCTSAVITAVFRRTGKAQDNKTHKLHISCFGKSAEYTAFVDTGNNLKDPVTGAPAIIMGIRDLKALIPRELYRLITSNTPANALEALSGTKYADRFRLLPYSAVGVSGGMLLALRADVKIDGKASPKTLIALSPTEVSDGGMYSALIGT